MSSKNQVYEVEGKNAGTAAPQQNMWGSFFALGISFLTYVLPSIIVLSIFSALGIIDFESGTTDDLSSTALVSFSLTQSALAIGFIFASLKLAGYSWRLLGFRQIEWRQYNQVLIAYAGYFVAAIIAFAIVAVLVPAVDLDQMQDTGFDTESIAISTYIAAFISLVLLAPISEEIIFRGFLFRGLARDIPWWIAAILSSGLFAVVHFQLNVGIDVFLLGIAACWLTMRTNSIYPAILLHMIKNAMAYLFTFVLAT